jgi:ribosomal subunit interface protein
MEVTVRTHHCQVPTRLRREAVTQLEHATRFFDRIGTTRVTFSGAENSRVVQSASVEISGRVKGQSLRARGAGEDHQSALDQAVARFERQLARYKARRIDRSQSARHRPDPAPTEHTGLIEWPGGGLGPTV